MSDESVFCEGPWKNPSKKHLKREATSEQVKEFLKKLPSSHCSKSGSLSLCLAAIIISYLNRDGENIKSCIFEDYHEHFFGFRECVSLVTDLIEKFVGIRDDLIALKDCRANGMSSLKVRGLVLEPMICLGPIGDALVQAINIRKGLRNGADDKSGLKKTLEQKKGLTRKLLLSVGIDPMTIFSKIHECLGIKL